MAEIPIADSTVEIGNVTIDIPEEIWNQFTPQGKINFMVHNLIDFMSNPAFHAPLFKSLRFQVREKGIIMPKEVVCHIGDRPIVDVRGAI